MRFIAALLLLAGLGFGQESDIKAAEQAWAKAITTGDAATLQKILGDQLIYAHSTGIVDSKSSYIAKVSSGRQKYEGVEHQNMIVKLYGNTAVVHAGMKMWGVNQSGKFDDTLMMLHVWLKNPSGWQLIAHQTTKLK